MSLDIDKIILHSLRAGNDGQPHADTRSQTLPADEAVQGLMAELHRIYNGKGGKGFGFFADPEADVAELAEGEEAPRQPSPAFRIALEQLLGEQTEFVPFSITLTQMLVKQLVEHALDEQGVLLIAKYNYVGVDYLMIALLEGKESVTVSEALEHFAKARTGGIVRCHQASPPRPRPQDRVPEVAQRIGLPCVPEDHRCDEAPLP